MVTSGKSIAKSESIIISKCWLGQATLRIEPSIYDSSLWFFAPVGDSDSNALCFIYQSTVYEYLLHPSLVHWICLRVMSYRHDMLILQYFFECLSHVWYELEPSIASESLRYPKNATQDKNAFTNSNVQVFFAGYRPTNFEKLSTMRMIYLI